MSHTEPEIQAAEPNVLMATQHAERTRLLFQDMPATLFMNIPVAVVLVILLWDEVSHTRLIMWLVGHLTLLALRAGLCVQYHRLLVVGAEERWLRYFRILVMVTGASWGLAALLFYIPHDVLHESLLAAVLAGVSAASIVALSVDYISARGVVLLSQTPLVVMLLLDRSWVASLIAITLVIFFFYLSASARRTELRFMESIRLRIEFARSAETANRNEQRWNFALEGVGDGVWDWYIPEDKVVLSRRWKAILGYEDHEIDNTLAAWETRIHPDDLATVKREIQPHLDGLKEIYVCEHRLRCKDGSWKWVLDRGRAMVRDQQGKPLRVIGTLSDISERKIAEAALTAKTQELETQTAFLDAIIDHIPIAVFVKDARDSFRITVWNRAAEDIFQVPKEVVLGKTTHDLWPKAEADVFTEADRKVTSEWRLIDIPEEYATTPSHGMIALHTKKVPIGNRQKPQADFLLGICEDISERKQAETIKETLHKISEATFACADLQQLFQHIHQLVGKLLPAKNFFVALYDAGRDELSFPYVSDEIDPPPPPCKLGNGLTELVLRSGRPRLLTPQDVVELIDSQSVSIRGAPPHSWIGVPLNSERRSIGMIGAFVYEKNFVYTEHHLNLLQLISYQVAITIERKQHEAHIEHLALYDGLTDLPNRALFGDRLQLALAKARREQTALALMYLDLDEFKPVNDRYGHATGDLLLNATALRIRGCLRESDTVGRFGGDEFVVLLTDIGSESYARLVAEKIRQTLMNSFALNTLKLGISCSIGIAVFPEHGIDEKGLSLAADAAMYEAKKAGRNCVVMASKAWS